MKTNKNQKIDELTNNASDWAKDIINKRLNRKNDVEAEETVMESIEDDSEESECCPNDCKNCEYCDECEYANHCDCNCEDCEDECECSDCIEEDEELLDECDDDFSELYTAYRTISTKLLKKFNGILDKTVAIELLENKFKEHSLYKEIIGHDDDVNARKEAIMCIREGTYYNLLEWRNLLMTRSAYKRLVRIFAELNSVAVAKNMGVDLNVGCTFPKQWES